LSSTIEWHARDPHSDFAGWPLAANPLAPASRPHRRGRKKNHLPKNQEVSGNTRDQVGRVLDMSGTTYQKARAVVEAAESDPRRYGDLVEEMDSTGQVNRAFQAVEQRRLAKQRFAEGKRVVGDAGVLVGTTVILRPPA
jgi:hypothetical protein